MTPPFIDPHSAPRPLHFDLGLESLASADDFAHLPHDWEGFHRDHPHHGMHEWPTDTKTLQLWAATLDVPGF